MVTEDPPSEVRVRKEDGRCVMTLKAGSGLKREEREFEIGKEDFERLSKAAIGREIRKTRYALPYRENTLYLDFYLGELKGLVVAEVEFRSVEEAGRFEPPAWFGREITAEKGYKNSSLALSNEVPAQALKRTPARA